MNKHQAEGYGCIILLIIGYAVINAIGTWIKNTPAKVLFGYGIIACIGFFMVRNIQKHGIQGLFRMLQTETRSETIAQTSATANQAPDQSYARLQAIAEEMRGDIPLHKAQALLEESTSISTVLVGQVEGVKRHAESQCNPGDYQ